MGNALTFQDIKENPYLLGIRETSSFSELNRRYNDGDYMAQNYFKVPSELSSKDLFLIAALLVLIVFPTLISSRTEIKLISIVDQIESLLQNLSKDIRINNINSIRDYLIEFPDITDIIPKAVNSAKKYFPNAQIVLDFYIDPEIDDKHPIIYVRAKDYDNKFMELLDKARKDFMEDLINKRGWILLTTDFGKPDE
jgi:predicted RNase H-like HicB family nuclease